MLGQTHLRMGQNWVLKEFITMEMGKLTDKERGSDLKTCWNKPEMMIRTGVVLAGQMWSIFFYVYISIYIYIYTQCICIYRHPSNVEENRHQPSSTSRMRTATAGFHEARIDLKSWTQWKHFETIACRVSKELNFLSQPFGQALEALTKMRLVWRPRFSSLNRFAQFFWSREVFSVAPELSNRKSRKTIKINQNRPSGNLT